MIWHTELCIMSMFTIVIYGNLQIFYALHVVLYVIHVCQVLILHLSSIDPNPLITGIMVREKRPGDGPSWKILTLWQCPHRKAPNAVQIQTYQGLLRDLRTRSKTCRRTQSKLNLTSTSSPRL